MHSRGIGAVAIMSQAKMISVTPWRFDVFEDEVRRLELHVDVADKGFHVYRFSDGA